MVGFSWPLTSRRYSTPVGGPLVDDAAAVGRELRRLQDEQPLGHPVDAGQAVEVPLDDDRAHHAAEHLVVRGAVQVRVIVVDAGRMIGRELELVLEALAGRDAEEGVVRVAGRARRGTRACGGSCRTCSRARRWRDRLSGAHRNGLSAGSPAGSASRLLTRLTRRVSPGRMRSVGPGKEPS